MLETYGIVKCIARLRVISSLGMNLFLLALVFTLGAMVQDFKFAAPLVAIWAVLWLMAFLGFRTTIPPVEITYDPYEDGTTLEDLTAEGIPALPEVEEPADPASGTPSPPK